MSSDMIFPLVYLLNSLSIGIIIIRIQDVDDEPKLCERAKVVAPPLISSSLTRCHVEMGTPDPHNNMKQGTQVPIFIRF